MNPVARRTEDTVCRGPPVAPAKLLVGAAPAAPPGPVVGGGPTAHAATASIGVMTVNTRVTILSSCFHVAHRWTISEHIKLHYPPVRGEGAGRPTAGDVVPVEGPEAPPPGPMGSPVIGLIPVVGLVVWVGLGRPIKTVLPARKLLGVGTRKLRRVNEAGLIRLLDNGREIML